MTKERFLKAISADPPELVDANQNAALEEELKEAKAALKRKKVGMEEMVREIEEMGRRLAQSMYTKSTSNRCERLLKTCTC